MSWIWERSAGQIGTLFSEAVFHETHACWHSLVCRSCADDGLLTFFGSFAFLVKHRAWLIGVEDVIYWVFASFTVFGLFYLENDGALRFYMIGAVIFGMILYDRMVSTNFFRVLKKAGRCFRIKIRKKTQKQSR